MNFENCPKASLFFVESNIYSIVCVSMCVAWCVIRMRACVCFNFFSGCVPLFQISLWTSGSGPFLMVTLPGSQIAFFIALKGYKFFVIPSWVLTSYLKVKSSVSHYCFLGLASIAPDQHVINVLRVWSSFSSRLGSNLRYTEQAHISVNLGKLAPSLVCSGRAARLFKISGDVCWPTSD